MNAADRSRPRAVLFDLDGTLVDSRADIAAACNHALVSQGRAPLPLETISGFVGDGARTLLMRAFALRSDHPTLDRAVHEFRSFYETHPVRWTTVLPGVREVLSLLTSGTGSTACACAVITNKPRRIADAVLDRLGMRDSFVAVRGGGDGPLKPDPWSILDVLATLGIAPEAAWMVGDGPQDIGAGRAAGCWTVAVRTGFGTHAALADAMPHCTLDSMADLAAVYRECDQPGP